MQYVRGRGMDGQERFLYFLLGFKFFKNTPRRRARVMDASYSGAKYFKRTSPDGEDDVCLRHDVHNYINVHVAQYRIMHLSERFYSNIIFNHHRIQTKLQVSNDFPARLFERMRVPSFFEIILIGLNMSTIIL